MQCLLLPLFPTENLAEPRLSALTSTSPPVVAAATATTHKCAAAVIPVAMLPRPSNSSHPPAPMPSNPRHPVSATKSKVVKLRRHVTPQVSSPIDIYRLELELANDPDKTFVFNLLSMLREGAHIGYSGPRTHRVSPNLISAAQHPDVVTSNLHRGYPWQGSGSIPLTPPPPCPIFNATLWVWFPKNTQRNGVQSITSPIAKGLVSMTIFRRTPFP